MAEHEPTEAQRDDSVQPSGDDTAEGIAGLQRVRLSDQPTDRPPERAAMGNAPQAPAPTRQNDRALGRSVSDALSRFFRGELRGFSSSEEFLQHQRERSDSKS